MQQLFHRLGDIDHVIWDRNGTLLNDVPHAVDTINFLLEPPRHLRAAGDTRPAERGAPETPLS
jgi:hypothetical protein